VNFCKWKKNRFYDRRREWLWNTRNIEKRSGFNVICDRRVCSSVGNHVRVFSTWHIHRASNTVHVRQYRYFGIKGTQYRYTGIDTGIRLNDAITDKTKTGGI